MSLASFPKWISRHRHSFLVMVIVAALALVPIRARAQFGLDPCCAIVSVGLNTVSGLLKNVVAKPLSAIQQLRHQAADFEQQVVYPATAIDQARQSAAQLEAGLRQATQIAHLPVNSATLPSTQQLENSLLSRDSQALSSIDKNFAAVYGPVMNAADAPPAIRNLVDASDAETLAALKKAVELDAIAEVELSTAAQLSNELQSAAPGSAPILEAEAATWLVRADAYTQSGMAELLRLRSTALAARGAEMKLDASNLNKLGRHTADVLSRGGR